jgi:hypothetical protein
MDQEAVSSCHLCTNLWPSKETRISSETTKIEMRVSPSKVSPGDGETCTPGARMGAPLRYPHHPSQDSSAHLSFTLRVQFDGRIRRSIFLKFYRQILDRLLSNGSIRFEIIVGGNS